jgi:hypothetical protein
MMALLIFLTLFTMFTNSYLPLWMKDNERQHMTSVMDEMGTMKGKLEIQQSMVAISGQSSLPMFQTFQLGAAGIPVFVAPTVGVLSLMPADATTRIGMSVSYETASGSGIYTPLWENPVGGMVQLWAPNRYYVQQWIALENNGILTKQTDGQSMNVAPGIALNGAPSTMSVGIMNTNFLGSNTSVTGTGSGGVSFSTLYVDSDFLPFTGGTRNVVITINSTNGLAFFNYLDETCNSTATWTGHTKYTRTSDYFALSLENPLSPVQKVTLTIKMAVSLNTDIAYVHAALS